MPRGIPNRKPAPEAEMTTEVAPILREPAADIGPVPTGSPKQFRVLLKKAYRPAGAYKKVDLAGEAHTAPSVAADKDAGMEDKVKPGWVIEIPIDEAKTIIRAGIAERADELPS